MGRAILKVAAVLAALVASVQAEPRGEIVGRVVDASSGRPIKHATVRVVDEMMGSVCGDGGWFHVRHVPVGAYGLQARFIGYEVSTVEEVAVAEGDTTSVVFALAKGSCMTQSITVSVTPTTRAEVTQGDSVLPTSRLPHLTQSISVVGSTAFRAPQPYEHEGVTVFVDPHAGLGTELFILTTRGQFLAAKLKYYPREVVESLLALGEGERVRIWGKGEVWTRVERLE